MNVVAYGKFDRLWWELIKKGFTIMEWHLIPKMNFTYLTIVKQIKLYKNEIKVYFYPILKKFKRHFTPVYVYNTWLFRKKLMCEAKVDFSHILGTWNTFIN